MKSQVVNKVERPHEIRAHDCWLPDVLDGGATSLTLRIGTTKWKCPLNGSQYFLSLCHPTIHELIFTTLKHCFSTPSRTKECHILLPGIISADFHKRSLMLSIAVFVGFEHSHRLYNTIVRIHRAKCLLSACNETLRFTWAGKSQKSAGNKY